MERPYTSYIGVAKKNRGFLTVVAAGTLAAQTLKPFFLPFFLGKVSRLIAYMLTFDSRFLLTDPLSNCGISHFVF